MERHRKREKRKVAQSTSNSSSKATQQKRKKEKTQHLPLPFSHTFLLTTATQATTSFAHDPSSQYLVTTSVTTTGEDERNALFRVTAERASDSQAWAASFDAAALEALTAAAGARRSFGAVVRLVRAAFSTSGDRHKSSRGGASCDMLSADDIKGGAPPSEKPSTSLSSPSSSSAFPSLTAQSSKRYLVVSLSTEFDSAVYPLPLLAEPDAAAAARLRPLVAKLRSNAAASQLAAEDFPLELSRLRGEVDALRRALDESEASAQEQASRAEEAERELARERAARRRALRAAAADLEEAEAQAGSARAEVHAARLRCRALAGEVDELRRRMTGGGGGGGGGGGRTERENVAPARLPPSLAQQQQQQKPNQHQQQHSPSTSAASTPSPLARARALAAAGGVSEASRAPPLYSPLSSKEVAVAAAAAAGATPEKLSGSSSNRSSSLNQSHLRDPGAEVEARLGALRAFIDGARASRTR